ncbi:hypothetical protein RAG44_26615 [Klebsiella pneumoniae]|uniref:hypothetical protein n=1 Tax=Klebsiella pneumoniae TaxID=573 RepID=UPI001D181FA8|nr:hypothetical protein [Klebsiella pneumoniae]
MTLTAYYQLRNTKAAGLGFELLTSEPGAFIVLEESSYEKNRMKLPAMGITGVQAIVRMRSVAR